MEVCHALYLEFPSLLLEYVAPRPARDLGMPPFGKERIRGAARDSISREKTRALCRCASTVDRNHCGRVQRGEINECQCTMEHSSDSELTPIEKSLDAIKLILN